MTLKKVALVGDIGFFGKYSIANNQDVRRQFAEMAEYLQGFDYVIGNLEVPFVTGIDPKGAKSAHVQSDPRNAELLSYLNFTHVCLANNHVYDFGQAGIDMTLERLETLGIEHFGLNDKACAIEDARIALHGYCCYTTNPYGLKQGVNTWSIPHVQSTMKTFHEQGYLNIVGVHAGLEHVNFPAYHDVKMARQLSQTAPYVYYGHHPHVLQGIEEHQGSLLAYSLGNFCFDDVYTSKSPLPLVKQSDNNKTSAILELEVENGRLLGHRVTGFFADELGLTLHHENVQEKVAEYTAYLQTPEAEYTAHRNALLSDYIAGRKQMRDLNWYLKRLNFNSVIMLARAKYNARQHAKNVLCHLDATDG